MGCVYANYKINRYDQMKARSCPFCRALAAKSEGETNKKMMKRIKANDPAALSHMGRQRFNEEDYDSAFGYLTKAAELGDAEAHYQLGVMYEDGEGVEKDEEKVVYHYEKAAIGGHPWARHNLACVEEDDGNMERAVKHFIIAANLGDEDSMKLLWTNYSAGNITKEDLEATLRTHQAALDAMKSAQRDAAERACGNIR
jgi:TPR repeat protein